MDKKTRDRIKTFLYIVLILNVLVHRYGKDDFEITNAILFGMTVALGIVLLMSMDRRN